MAGGWRNEFQLSDTWSLVADASYSRADRDQHQPEINAQYGPALVGDTGTFRLRANNDMPSLSFLLDYTDPTQVLVGPTIYGSGYTKRPSIVDELTSFRLDAMREADMGWFVGTAFGVNYSERTKDKSSYETGLSTIDGLAYQIADEFLLSPTNLSYADAGEALALNVPGVLAEYFNPIVYGNPNSLPYLAGKFWDVEESVWTGYVRGDMSHEISDTVTLTGNVGLQFIATDQSSGSFQVDNKGTPNDNSDHEVFPVSDGATYTDVLPQVNFAFLLENDQAVRIGLAKEMARASYGRAQGHRRERLRRRHRHCQAATAETRDSIPGAPMPSIFLTRNTSGSAAAMCQSRGSTRTSGPTSSGRLIRTTITRICWRRFRQVTSSRASFRRRRETSRVPENGEGGYLWGSSCRPPCHSTCSRMRCKVSARS